MKRFLALAVISVIVLFLFSPLSAVALSSEAEVSDCTPWIEKLRQAMPSALCDRITLENEEDVASLVGFPFLLSFLFSAFTDELPSVFASLGAFCGLALLGGAVGLLGEGIEKPGLRRAVQVSVSTTVALSAYSFLLGAIERSLSALSDISSFSQAMLPVTGALYTLGGNVTAAATQASSMSLTLTLCETLSGTLLAPIIRACFAFALIGSLGTSTDTGAVAKSLRSIYLTLLGLLAAVATASLSLQTAVSASADSVALRTARFAVGNLIPVIGTAVGATLSTLSASLSLIKNTVGAGAVGILLLLLLPPIIELWLFSISLSAAKTLSAMLGFSDGERLFSDFKGIFDMTLAVLALTGVMFILSFAVFMKSPIAAHA